MHFLVRTLSDNKQFYVSMIYGENIPKTRRKLWQNLLDHKIVIGNDPLGTTRGFQCHFGDM